MFWERQKRCPSNAHEDEQAKKALRKWLTHLGCHFAKYRLDLVPDRASQLITLRITFDDEGPATRVGDIEIRGRQTTRAADILHHLQLEKGQRVDGDRRLLLEQKLSAK